MSRGSARWLLPSLLLALSCAGPSELARRSEVALAGGDPQKAWELAARALEREPNNARARAAAGAAVRTLSGDWMRRIRALADVDTLDAAGQVLGFAAFRAEAAPLVAVPLDSAWVADERALRHAAARIHYERGEAALASRRPKRAHDHFGEVERFVTGYRDVARLGDRALERAITRVAFVPFRGSAGQADLGREVSAAWRAEAARRLRAPRARFTRLVPQEEVEAAMSVAQLGRLTREEAIHLGRQVGARRIVWGTVGGVEADTRTDRFSDVVWRRLVEHRRGQRDTVRWIDVPIEVIARQRTVTAEIEVELISTDEEITLARHPVERTLTARTVWTSDVPEGDLESYELVAEPLRAEDPERVKRVETRWKAVAGEKTGVKEVLKGSRAARSQPRYRRERLPSFYPGASGPVFLEDLPPALDLALAALLHAWEPVIDDLQRFDAVDEADLEAER
jgi:hypothetical protein